MNTDTAELYRGQDAIAAAQAAGLPIVPISEQAARVVAAGHAELRRRQRKVEKKARRTQQKQSRRANRR